MTKKRFISIVISDKFFFINSAYFREKHDNSWAEWFTTDKGREVRNKNQDAMCPNQCRNHL